MNARDPVARGLIGNRRGRSVSSDVRRESTRRVICEVRRIDATSCVVEHPRDATLRIEAIRDDSSIGDASDRRVVDGYERVVAVVFKVSRKDLAIQQGGAAGESS